MDLGGKILQARKEAGLSQRQLCGDVITRNMLSQIEHGTAKPSMETLKYLASRLGKPMSYFLEENLDTAPLEVMDQLRQAEEALVQSKHRLAAEVLETLATEIPELRRKKLLLMAKLPEADLENLCDQLPDLDEELFLRAKVAYGKNQWSRCLHLLESMEQRDESWQLIRGKLHLEQGNPSAAAECFLLAGETKEVYGLLERCYRDMEDYKQAYFYAVKQKK